MKKVFGKNHFPHKRHLTSLDDSPVLFFVVGGSFISLQHYSCHPHIVNHHSEYGVTDGLFDISISID